jgi:hypothetical protein
MSKSSNEALMFQIRSGNLSTNQLHVLNFIKKRTELGQSSVDEEGKTRWLHYTIMPELEQLLVAKQSSVTSVVSLLEDTGIIYKKGTVKKENIKTGISRSYSCFYFEPREHYQNINAEKRSLEKFIKNVDILFKEHKDRLSEKTISELKKDLSRSSVTQKKIF